MAKTRAQRKAEKRRREAQLERQRQAGGAAAEESAAQHDTQAPVSGDVAEAEAVIRTGADPEDYGEHTQPREAAAVDAPVGTPEAAAEAPPQPPAPAPSRADVGAPAEAPEEAPRESRRERKRREKEEREKAKERDRHKSGQPAVKPEKSRGAVLGFFASCWAELKKVQWPDRDTLVQASAVTIIFVAVAAAYLGALDAIFNWLIQQLI